MPVYKSKAKTADNRQYYYKINYTNAFGKNCQLKSKKYSTKKEAEKAEAAKLLELSTLPIESYTFNQVADIFLREKKTRLKEQTYDRLEVMLNHFLNVLGDVKVDKLTIAQYQAALASIDNYTFTSLKKKLTPQYKNKLIRTFKQLIAFSKKRFDLYTTVPDKFEPYRVEQREEMKFITEQQLKQLLAAVPEEDIVNSSLYTLLFYLGLRIGEANALTWADIDFDSNMLSINKTLTTKKKTGDRQFLITTTKTKSSNRVLPMPNVVSAKLKALYNYYSIFPNFNEQFFVFGGYNPMPESTIQHAKNRYFKAAGLEQIRIHDFRHSCASYYVNNGASILLLSKLLGHSNTSMTLNRYSHLYKSELYNIISIVDAKAK